MARAVGVTVGVMVQSVVRQKNVQVGSGRWTRAVEIVEPSEMTTLNLEV